MALSEVKKISQAKSLIYDKLKTDLGDTLQVTLLEDERIENFKTNHAKGAVVVYYVGSAHSDSRGKNVVNTERAFRIVAYLQTRVDQGLSFRDNMIDAIYDSVAGLKFTTVAKADKVRPVDDNYLPPAEDADKQFYDHPVMFLVPAQYLETNYLIP